MRNPSILLVCAAALACDDVPNVVATLPAPAVTCTPASALQLSVGDIRTLTRAQIASLCVGGLGTASEYVMISFNNSNVAASTTELQLTSVGTIAVAMPATGNPIGIPRPPVDTVEMAFTRRAGNDVGGAAFAARARVARAARARQQASQFANIPSNPMVGSVVQLNANLVGNTCTGTPVLHPARVVAVLQNTIIFLDTLSPPGGYTDEELVSLSTTFDTLGYGIATTNFGAATDIDGNGRVAILFTPSVNAVGALGVFAPRDLFPATEDGCPESNEGEMFYMPVPDPGETINGDFTSKAQLSRTVNATLIHELQHVISFGRRLFVNNAPDFQEVWLEEGMSHIAEELLYFATSGNAPLQNIDDARIRSSQAQLDAFNTDQIDNFRFLSTYLAMPESHSPFADDDELETRGAIWQLLRYGADQKGGNQRDTWFALVNSTTSGQASFNEVFGDIINVTRTWAIAQFTDDAGLEVPPLFTSPSWNYRSVFTGLFSGFPLETHSLVAGTTVQLALVGGGASYVRFGISAGVAASVRTMSANREPPSNIEMVLVRTK